MNNFKEKIEKLIDVENTLRHVFSFPDPKYRLNFNHLRFGALRTDDDEKMMKEAINILKATGKKYYLAITYQYNDPTRIEVYFHLPKLTFRLSDEWIEGCLLIRGYFKDPKVLSGEISTAVLIDTFTIDDKPKLNQDPGEHYGPVGYQGLKPHRNKEEKNFIRKLEIYQI